MIARLKEILLLVDYHVLYVLELKNSKKNLAVCLSVRPVPMHNNF